MGPAPEPQLPFGRSPPIPPLQLEDPSLKPQPFPPHPLPSSSPHLSGSFCSAPEGPLVWGRCPRAQGGGGGEPSKRHLGPNPHLGVLNQRKAPTLGSAERLHADLFRFPRFLPICSDLRSILVFGNTPICSDLFRFAPIASDLFSEQIRETPFCQPLLQVSDQRKAELQRQVDLQGAFAKLVILSSLKGPVKNRRT